MDGTHTHLTVTTFLSFLVLTLLQASVQAQEACSVPQDHYVIPENNKLDELIATITLQPGATVSLNPPEGPDNPFKLNGAQLLAAAVFDAEEKPSHAAGLMCHPPAGSQFPFIVAVVVKNLNDNSPSFQQAVYKLSVNELSPVNTVLGRIDADDLDKLPLYYRLDGETHGFKLQSPTVPEILVQTPQNYDTIKNVSLRLYVQDTPLTSPDITPSHSNTTSVEITILDVDNRPPWFQPCTKYQGGDNVICSSSGYTGRVTLNKKEPGFLNLNPGPLYAIDGDDGINEEITYKILGGNDGNLFEIDPNTGNISMQREANTSETITLTVLASQKINTFQGTSISVTISVVSESLHLPKFQNTQYQGTISGVGNMALNMENKPLQFLAMDDDYNATGGLNPNINYEVEGHSEFSIVGGFLFMTKALPEATLKLKVVARDTSNDETAEAELLLEVKPGPTAVPSTTGSVSSPSPSTPTVGTGTTTAPPGVTTKPTGGTGPTPTPSGTITTPTGSTDGTGPTPTPSGTITTPTGSTDGTGPTPTPSGTITIPTGSTDGTGQTPAPSGTTTKPTGSTDGTGPTPTPSGTITTPTGSTDGTGPTPTPSGTITKPTGSTDGTGPTPTPSGTITKPTGTTDGTSVTTTPSRTTTNPSATSEPSQTSNGSVPTANTPRPITVPPGCYGPGDMAALGATLGVLLCGSLVTIAFLIIHIRRDQGDWKKIYETIKFRSNLNKDFGGEKEGIQYTNDAFSNDDDASSTQSGNSDGGSANALQQPRKTAQDLESYLTPKEISAPPQYDTTSHSDSDGDDKEKEVRPILTKSRRQDEGYKSVWFKEDIDPEAKEEVVIFPDSRENNSDEEEQEQRDGNREDNDRGYSDTKKPKTRVLFKDDKSNSGGEDSHDDEVLTVNL